MSAAASSRGDGNWSEHALIGRDRHVRELRLILDALTEGRGNLVLVAGDAGMGKTRLTEEACGSRTKLASVRLASRAGPTGEQTSGLQHLRYTQLRELVTDDAIVVENECRFDGPDGEYLWRAVDLLRIGADEIVEHTQYCSGCWSPADIARQSVEAPMVRW